MASAEKKFVYTLQTKYEGSNELNKLKSGLQAIGDLKSFDRLNTNISRTTDELAKAETEAEKLKKVFDESKDSKAGAAYERAAAALDKLSARYTKQNVALTNYAGKLNTAQASLKNIQAAWQADPTEKNAAAYRKAVIDVAKLTTGYNKKKAALDTLKSSMDQAAITAQKLGTAFEKSHDKKAAADYRNAKNAVSGLTSEIKKQEKELGRLDTSLKKTGIDTSKLATEQKKLESAMQSRGSVVAARSALEIRSTRDIKSEILGLSTAYNTLKNSGKSSMQELSVAKERLRSKTEKLHRELGKGPGIFTKSAQGMRSLHGIALSLSALFGGFGAGMFVKSVFDAGVASEKLSMAFTNIYGSGAKAEEELKFIKAVSAELGQEFEVLAKSYQNIAASAKGTKLEGAGTRKFVVAMSEVSKVLGTTSDQMNRAFAQIGQGMGKGTFELEDLKTLAEALPGIGMKDFADSIDVSTEKFYEMITAGEVVSDEFIPALSNALHEKFGPAAKEIETAQGSVNNMKNAWFELRVQVANSGFLDKASEGMDALANALKDPAVQQAAMDLANTILTLGDYIFRTGFFAKATFEAVAAGILTIVQEGAGMISMFALLTDAIGLTTGAYDELQAISKAAEGAAIELAGKSIQSWGSMKKGVTGYGNEVKKTESVVEATFAKNAAVAAKSAAEQESATKAKLKSMQAEYKKYADTVKILQDQIAGREKSLAQELRSMGRSGMSDLGAWQDRKKEAEEYEAAAKKAAAAGDFEEAIALADKAKDSYKSLNEEVTDNNEVMISKQDALKTSMSGVEAAGNLAISILEKQKTAAEEAMAALDAEASGELSGKESVTETTTAIIEQKQEIVKVGDTWTNVWKENKQSGDDVLDGLQDKIDKMDGTVIKLYVEEVAKRRWGGMVGNLQMVNALRMATGGKLSGYGGGDKIRALLEAGEYIIRKEAVKKYSPGFLHAINTMQLDTDRPQIRARIGGYISNATAPLLMQGGGAVSAPQQSNGHYTVTINRPVPYQPIHTMTPTRYDADALIRELQRKGDAAA